MPFEPSLQRGSIRSYKKRIFEISANLYDTQSLSINNQIVPFRGFDEAVLDIAVPGYTGIKTLRSILGYSYDGQITLTQGDPLKMTVLGLDYKVSVGI